MRRHMYGVLVVGACSLIGCGTIEGVRAEGKDGTYECLLIDAADIAVDSLHSEPNEQTPVEEHLMIANQGHSVVDGNFAVVSVREFSGTDKPVDGQSFRKLTFKMSGTEASETPIEVSESYFTSGSSGFVGSGFYYYSRNQLKTVVLKREDDGIYLMVDQAFPSVLAIDGSRGMIGVKFSCRLQRKKVDQLNAWEGKPASGHEAFYRHHND